MPDPVPRTIRAQHILLLEALAAYDVTLEDDHPPHIAAITIAAPNRDGDTLRARVTITG